MALLECGPNCKIKISGGGLSLNGTLSLALSVFASRLPQDEHI